jgi:serine/threonine protein kinase
MNFDIRKNCVKIGKQISKGGFGFVYFAKISDMPQEEKYKNNNNVVFIKMTDDDKPNAAVKNIKHSDSRGVDSLCELYILNRIHHPYILHCCACDINKDGDIRIVLPLACSDLSVIRKTKIKLPLHILRKWCWQMVTAVSHLHSNGIVHADIKPGNVLLYGDLNDLENVVIKVSDYSLSVIITDPKKGTYDVDGWHSYTSTFRPIEIWQKEAWSYPSDIWALGCTFYEMLYGVVLFYDQGDVKNEDELAIDAIVEWSKKNLHHNIENLTTPKIRTQSISIHHVPIPPTIFNVHYSSSAPESTHFIDKYTFKPCNLSSDWFNSNNHEFNELILSMLDINPLKRITIWELLEHPYFDELYDENLVPKRKSYPYIAYGIEKAPKNIVDKFEKYTADVNVCSIALSLYLRSRTESDDDPKIETCILVAHKLLYKSGPKNLPKSTLESRLDEARLCQILNFNLLP